MSQIEELRAFVTIVETGSLTQAADRLGIAVSAVSRRLRDLELRLGAALIQRSTRRLYLNETGQVFFERCKIILSDLEDAQQEVRRGLFGRGLLIPDLCHLDAMFYHRFFGARHDRFRVVGKASGIDK